MILARQDRIGDGLHFNGTAEGIAPPCCSCLAQTALLTIESVSEDQLDVPVAIFGSPARSDSLNPLAKKALDFSEYVCRRFTGNTAKSWIMCI